MKHWTEEEIRLLKEIHILFFSLVDFKGKKIILLLSSIKIGDLDYKIKSGLIDKVSGMELFLFGI